MWLSMALIPSSWPLLMLACGIGTFGAIVFGPLKWPPADPIGAGYIPIFAVVLAFLMMLIGCFAGLILRSIDFAFECGATAVSVIPGRDGSAELQALTAQKLFSPPLLGSLEAVLDYGLSLQRGRVFADLWDVAHLTACPRCSPARISRLRKTNLTQVVLPEVDCPACTPCDV
jgi:hypothetical protein